jgi:hypothetical protein
MCLMMLTHRYQTDEQAPLPEALAQLVDRVESGLDNATDFIFNCQMGRGRTTSGQIAASLIATTRRPDWRHSPAFADEGVLTNDSIDGPSEEEAYNEGDRSTHVVGIVCSLLLRRI